MAGKRSLICGVGINDVNYNVSKEVTINGKRVRVFTCPYYDKWAGMLERCYNKNYHKVKPTYEQCTVAPEWLYLSNFIKWVDSQPNKDWINCQLDKDVLIVGNKHYCPDTCAFITPKLNSFLTERGNGRGLYLLGCYFHKECKKFVAKCSNPLDENPDNGRYLGLYHTQEEAHLAWKAKKHEYACILAEYEADPRVKESLTLRYL